MTKKRKARPARVEWGTGRVAVLANLAVIQRMLDEGWPMTGIYAQLQDSLAGLRYNSFSHQVRTCCKRRASHSEAVKNSFVLEPTAKPVRCS